MNMAPYSILQLAMIVQCAPDRRVLWNRLEHAAAAELDQRLAPGVKDRAA